jgi:ABC-2 type transport system permease protein
MNAPTSVIWFARHEISLFWRDFVALMTAGQTSRTVGLIVAIVMGLAIAHLIAGAFIGPWAADGISVDKHTLLLITGAGILFVSLMLSQAMESVTRAYYARADLDLILSSPASPRRLFAVRTGAIALTTLALSFLLAGPAIDMLVLSDGSHWLAAYGVLASLAAFSTALAVLFTIGLFALVGPKRTRLISQIAAAAVGAGFIIGLQAIAILSFGSFSRFAIFESDAVAAAAPALDSMLWIPARAAMSDPVALGLTMLAGFGSLIAVIIVTASSFGQHAIAAAGVSATRTGHTRRLRAFRGGGAKAVLRRKEWALLRRDPWLLSQTLMQILYLIPPALLLWLNFGEGAGAMVVIVPVVVMAAGQLAGGLAWLAVSGEDAADLITSAPVTARMVLGAKIQSVLAAIAIVTAPLIIGIAFAAPIQGAVTAAGVVLAACSATAVQMWFRVQAKRSMFRRRQISSRAATITEAFASIMWAGTAALAAVGSPLTVMPAIAAIGVLGFAYAIRPRAKA